MEFYVAADRFVLFLITTTQFNQLIIRKILNRNIIKTIFIKDKCSEIMPNCSGEESNRTTSLFTEGFASERHI